MLGDRIVIDDGSAPVVKVENIKVHSGKAGLVYENRSKANVLLLENCNGELLCTGGGDAFMTNVAGGVRLSHPDADVWARQLNPEGTRHEDRINCLNEIFFHKEPYRFMVVEERGDEVRKLTKPKRWPLMVAAPGDEK